jgi:hypothetical protein
MFFCVRKIRRYLNLNFVIFEDNGFPTTCVRVSEVLDVGADGQEGNGFAFVLRLRAS